MPWRRTGDYALSELMMTWFIDACLRQSATLRFIKQFLMQRNELPNLWLITRNKFLKNKTVASLISWYVNSLGPSDAKWHFRSVSSLAQVISCGLIGSKPFHQPMQAYHCWDPSEHDMETLSVLLAFVCGIQRSPQDLSNAFSLVFAKTTCRTNSPVADDLGRDDVHVTSLQWHTSVKSLAMKTWKIIGEKFIAIIMVPVAWLWQ